MDRHKIELNAILEITQAINQNMSEDNLYKVFQFTCLSLIPNIPISLLVVGENGCFSAVKSGIDISESKFDYILEKVNEDSVSRKDVLNDRELENVHYLMSVKHKHKLLAVVLIGESPVQFSNHQSTLINTVANIVMVAIENKRLARKQLRQEVMEKELSIARNVQQNLVPDHLPSNETFELFASYTPFGEVGGDYYDYVPLSDERFLFCIGDVQGKGVPAAMVMSNFQASFKALTSQNADLESIVEELNRLLYNAAKGSHFISFFVGLMDLPKGELTYINAGHNPPVLMRANGESKFLNEGTMILGAIDKLVFVNVGKENLSASDLIFLFTDGVTEVFNEENDEFGEERLREVIKTERKSPLNEIQESLLAEMNRFRGTRNFSDDLTTLMLRVH